MTELANGAMAERRAHVWARDDLDWYVEPEGATTALARVERFNGSILDPCCGGGNVVRALLGRRPRHGRI